VPAIGAAIDNHRTSEPYWQRVFEGFERSKAWMRETKPDVCIIVYNDHAFLDNLSKDPKKLTRLSHLELMREAGAEGVEMVMWLIMRGALDDKVDEVYRFYTVPASNTAVGHIILENKKKAGKKPAPKMKRAAARQKVQRIRS
jgi:hypothetical protein